MRWLSDETGVPYENPITITLVELLRQRLAVLSWQVRTQSPRGFTGSGTSSGGAGERDLELVFDGRLLSIGEALRVQSWDKRELGKHFKKLFGYSHGTVPHGAVIIYSFAKDPAKIWKKYQTMVENLAPAGFDFVEFIPVDFVDHTPGVWVVCSKHCDAHGSTRIVSHLLVDLAMTYEQDAAADARSGQQAVAQEDVMGCAFAALAYLLGRKYVETRRKYECHAPAWRKDGVSRSSC